MIADRLKLARKKAGLSLRDLSDAMENKVTAQAIGKYERCESTPSSGVLIALSKALGVSLSYLMDNQGIELAGVEFRTRASTSGRDRAKVETEVLEWIDRYLQIEMVLELDSAEWQRPVAKLRKLPNADAAEDLASEVRKTWNLGADPIPNMTELLEEKGLKVLTVPLPERVSGFTCLVKRPRDQADLPVIVVNNRFSLERRRLTLAHELAHRLIDTNSLEDKEEERAANVFAGAFLMPGEHLLREVGKHRNALGYKELIDLKRLYRVSGATLLVRLRQLDVISQSTLVYAFQTIGRGWRSQEPHELEEPDKRGKHERALRFERLCYRALAEGLISLSKASELLRLPVTDVEAGLKGPQNAEQPPPHQRPFEIGPIGSDVGGIYIQGGTVHRIPPYGPVMQIMQQITAYTEGKFIGDTGIRSLAQATALTGIMRHAAEALGALDPIRTPSPAPTHSEIRSASASKQTRPKLKTKPK